MGRVSKKTLPRLHNRCFLFLPLPRNFCRKHAPSGKSKVHRPNAYGSAKHHRQDYDQESNDKKSPWRTKTRIERWPLYESVLFLWWTMKRTWIGRNRLVPPSSSCLLSRLFLLWLFHRTSNIKNELFCSSLRKGYFNVFDANYFSPFSEPIYTSWYIWELVL